MEIKTPEKIDLSSIVLAIAAYFVIKLFDNHTDNTQSLPVIVNRLGVIESKISEIETNLGKARNDPFTGTEGKQMKESFEGQIWELRERMRIVELKNEDRN